MEELLFQLPQGLNLLPYDGEALFYPNLIPPGDSSSYFNRLLNETKWEQLPIRIYDKEMMQPRLTAFHGDYGKLDHSGLAVQAQPWTKTLEEIKQKVESISNVKFTHALLNLYRDGKDSVSWHRDNEQSWGPNPTIGSASFGVARIFQFRYYTNKKIVRSIELTPGSFLLMRGTTQRFWEHQVPKSSKRIGARINITFRILYNY